MDGLVAVPQLLQDLHGVLALSGGRPPDAAGVLGNGEHTLTVLAHDDVENVGTTSVTFTIER